jgi:hypothetical protein
MHSESVHSNPQLKTKIQDMTPCSINMQLQDKMVHDVDAYPFHEYDSSSSYTVLAV